jgi:transposase
MRSIARRIIAFNDEVKLHDRAIRELIAEAAPQLVVEPGIGHVTAGMFVIAWSHPGRCRNEAAFARLARVAPLPATSGQGQDRHRLNRNGDRQLNSALRVVALSRARHHQPTRDDVERRRAEGRTDFEIRRCLERYIARHLWRLLGHPPTADLTA